MTEKHPQTTRVQLRRREYVCAAAVVVTGWFFWVVFGYATMIGISAIGMWILALCLSVVFVVTAIVCVMMLSSVRIITPLIAIAFVPTLFFDTGVLHLVVAGVGVVMFVYGLRVMRRTIFNLITPDISLVVHSGAFYVMTALIIITSSHYYFYLKRHAASIAPVTVSQTVTGAVADRMVDVGTSSHSSVDATTTVDEYLQRIVEQSVAHNMQQSAPATGGWTAQWLQAPTSYVVEYTVGHLRGMLSGSMGRTVHSTDLARDVFADMIDMQLSTLINRNYTLHRYRVEIFGTTFFIVVTALAPLLRFVVILFVRAGVYLLRRYNIVHVADRTMHVKRMVL